MGDYKEDVTGDPVNNLALNPGPNAFQVSKHRGARQQRVAAALSKRLVKAGIKKPGKKTPTLSKKQLKTA